MADTQRCYKVVRVTPQGMRSVMAPKGLQVHYNLGDTTYPEVGALLAFDNLKGARSLATRLVILRQTLSGVAVLSGRGERVQLPEYGVPPEFLQMRTAEYLWAGGSGGWLEFLDG